jgi:predicted dehydrogenase
MKLILAGISGFSERWVNVLFDTPGVTVSGLVNRSPDKFPALCRKFNVPIEKCFSTLGEALEKTDAEAVVVTLPTPLHHALVRQALLAGRHVLVEKPLAATLAQSRDLVKLAKRKKRTLSVVSQHRLAPYLKLLKQYCDGGALGRPLSFYIRIHMNRQPSYYEVEARRTGPGVLTSQGVHALDWIHWLFGPVKTCSASIGTLLHKTHNEDTALAMMTTRSKVMGLLDINHIHQGKDQILFRICFAKGTLQFGPDGRMTEEANGTLRDIEYPKVNPQFDSLRDQLLNFAGAVNGSNPLEVTAQDGLNVMALLASLYKNTRKQAKVRY